MELTDLNYSAILYIKNDVFELAYVAHQLDCGRPKEVYMNKKFRFILCAFTAVQACMLEAANRSAMVSAPSATRPFSFTQKALAALPPSFASGIWDREVQVALGPMDLEAVGREDALRIQEGKAFRIGVVRDFSEAIALVDAKSSKGQWVALDDGSHSWRLTVQAEGAVGLRVHVAALELPTGGELSVYATEDPTQTRGPYTSAGLKERKEFWTGAVFANCVTLECHVPAGVLVERVALRVDKIAHIYRDPTRVAKEGSCHNDVRCFPAWAEAANGVAGIGSFSYADYIWCTGCLLNDLDDATWVDYFMTANHCVGNQSEADDTEFYWFFQTASCHGAPPNIAMVQTTDGGADYLAGQAYFPGNDFTFLRLREPPPGGVSYRGWTTAQPGQAEGLACIHHPDGAYKRISFCSLDDIDPNYWVMRYSSGVTEAGSSGAPLFNASGEFIGQLFGGQSSCANSAGTDDFGRFDVSYGVIGSWLRGEGTPPETCELRDGMLSSTGSYDAFLYGEREFGGELLPAVRGTLAVKVSSLTGRFTAKAVMQGRTVSFTSKGWDGIEPDGTWLSVVSRPGGEKLTLFIRQGSVWGSLTGGVLAGELLQVEGTRNRFLERNSVKAQNALKRFLGYYTVALPAIDVRSLGAAQAAPEGSGYLTITIGSRGSVKLAGLLADGTKISQASRLILFDECGEWACVPFFVSLYSRKGWAGALLWLTPGARTVSTDWGTDWFARWEKPGSGPDGFSELLAPCGGYYSAYTALAPYYRLSAASNSVPYFYAGGSTLPQQDALPRWEAVAVKGQRMAMVAGVRPVLMDEFYDYSGENSSLATLSFASRTGIYKGKFNLYYDYLQNGRLMHKAVKASYAGVMTQTRDNIFVGWPEGQGAYLVPDSDPLLRPYRVKRSFWCDLYRAP